MSKSKFSEDFQTLKNSKIVLLPVEVINPFIEYCNAQNVRPCGGALVQTSGGSMLQYLYL